MSSTEPLTAAEGLDGSATAAPGQAPRFWRDNRITVIAGGVAVALVSFIWLALPHDREVTSLWLLLFKLTPYAAASVAVAWLDVYWARRLRLHLYLLPVSFLLFFCYFVPKLFFYAGQEDGFGRLYYLMLALVPFISLSFVLAFRLGGGSRSGVLRVASALILLQLSGLEDLAFLTLNDHPSGSRYASIPEVWTWASHITVFLGHPATKIEAFAFIGVHVILALLVLFLPGRVFAVTRRRR
jgi:hypothetical protein